VSKSKGSAHTPAIAPITEPDLQSEFLGIGVSAIGYGWGFAARWASGSPDCTPIV